MNAFQLPVHLQAPTACEPCSSFFHLCRVKQANYQYRSILFKAAATRLAAVIIPLILSACAAIVAPSGGPKDEKPPVLLHSSPVNLSVNFKGDRLVLTFDEYVSLKNPEKEVLISPPLSKEPVMQMKGKSLVVKLKDTLRSNTTYSFFFGNAIVDITEANPLANFNFAFSTGPGIDSLSISGRVVDAYSLLPVKEAAVLLYTDFTDSVPKKDRPVYVSRTNASGDFTIRNLAAAGYRVVALKDANNDFIYNMPNESVAFLPDSVKPYYAMINLADTAAPKAPAAENQLQLLMFPEPDSVQRLAKNVLASAGRILLTFRYPTRDVQLVPVTAGLPDPWYIPEFSRKADSLSFWIIPPVPDTVSFTVSEKGQVLDTLTMATKPKPKQASKGKAEEPKNKLPLRLSLESGNKLGWAKPLFITTDNPIAGFDPDRVSVSRLNAADTVPAPFHFADSIRRTLASDFDWNTGEEYTLIFPGGVLKDIYGNQNDTLMYKFKVIPKDEYGSLKVKLNKGSLTHPFIIQLLGDKEAVWREVYVTSAASVNFGFLKPGKYRVKAIYDANANGKWDTGNFLRWIQPEKVSMYPKELEIRANWDLEEEWNF